MSTFFWFIFTSEVFCVFPLRRKGFMLQFCPFGSPGGAAMAAAVNAGRKRVFSLATGKIKADFSARHGFGRLMALERKGE